MNEDPLWPCQLGIPSESSLRSAAGGWRAGSICAVSSNNGDATNKGDVSKKHHQQSIIRVILDHLVTLSGTFSAKNTLEASFAVIVAVVVATFWF